MEWLHFVDTPVSIFVVYILIQRDMALIRERISRIEGVVFKQAKGA